jgi:signal transduction histidine kinase
MILVAVGLVLSVVAIASSDGELHPAPHQYFNPVMTVTFSIVGALIATRHPRNPIGWMFAGTGFLMGLDLLAMGYSMYSRAVMIPNALAGAAFTEWLGSWVWIPPTVVPMTFLLLLFPDGRLPSPRWRPLAWVAGLGLTGSVLSIALYPSLLYASAEPDTVENAVAAKMLPFLYVAFTLLMVGILGSVASLIVRFRRSSGLEREQMKWLAYAGVFIIVGFVASSVVFAVWPDNPMGEEMSIIITSLSVVGIVVATGIAMARHRLYDIDLLINRTLVYGALTAIVIGLYILVVASFGALLQARESLSVSLFATGLVAVSFQPLRERLQRGVNRLMYGERDEPYAVLSRLGRRLEATLAPAAVLPTIVETVAQALKLPYVAIILTKGKESEIAAAFGSPTEDTFILPLTYQAESIGRLVCAQRSPGEPFNAAEQRLLEDMAHQVGVAVHAVRLTADLQRSRQRLVTTREEERRRLRRDLHDGLGPTLAAMALEVDAARNILLQDPTDAATLLADLKGQIQTALGDIRRLVYDLRPPALDELGLIQALRGQAEQYNQASRLSTSVAAPDPLPPLPAAVEVAAYRITMEALTNVVRHAQANTCQVEFSLPEGEMLIVEIADDGIGLPSDLQSGVGLTSMRERAEELGGTFKIEPNIGGGTQIVARLPLLSQ